MQHFVFFNTFIAMFMTTVVHLYTNKAIKAFVYKIEYDALTKQLVIVQPSKRFLSFGPPQTTLVELQDFKMFTNEQLEDYKHT